jgi:4-amino-4-deoxy-L-arabinose transferase-like glycosyltransferase
LEGQVACAKTPLACAGLAALVAVYCGLAVVQSLATRLQWGPDEPAHIIYVRSLAMDGRLPSLTHGEEDNAYVPGAARTHEAHQPPLYYALAALAWRAFAGRPEQLVTYVDRSGVSHQFAVPGPVRPVRFLSVLLGALTLVVVWLAAGTVFPGRPALQLGAVALTGFTPMFTYMSGVINNDALLAPLFAVTAWQWARILRFGGSRRDIVGLGLLVGAAMLTKETAVGLLAVSVAAVALDPAAKSWRDRVARVAGVIALTCAVGGWWFIHKWALYGKPMVYPFIYPLLGLPAEERVALLAALPRCVFLFTFIPLDVISAHANVNLLSRFFGGLAVLSAGGLALALLRRQRLQMPRFEILSLVLWVLAAVIVLVGLVRNVLLVDWRMGTSGGRYMVAVLPLLSLVSARGLSALLGERRWAARGLALIGILLLAANIYAVWATASEYGALGL